MKRPSGVSRRIEVALIRYSERRWEEALLNIFPAMDVTAKKRRQSSRVGDRFRAFVSDEEGLITSVSTGMYIAGNTFDGMTFPDALYKFGRNSIVHDAELDKRLTFNEKGHLTIGRDRWDLPVQYIFGLCIVTIVAPENALEQVSDDLSVTVFGDKHQVNDLWGKREFLRERVREQFGNSDLFSK